MTPAAEKLKIELSRLAEPDRAELATFLMGTLDEDGEDVNEEAFDAELERRSAEIECGAASGEPAERVLRELREKYS